MLFSYKIHIMSTIINNKIPISYKHYIAYNGIISILNLYTTII